MGRTKTFVREDILDKAIQLFWTKGYADTSLSDLEKATGVNKSGLYSEFKDKEDIYVECLKRYRDVHPGHAILNTAPFGWDNIEKYLKYNMNCKGRKGCFFSNSLRENAIIPARATKVMSDNTAFVREILEKNLKAAGVKKNLQSIVDILMTFNIGISLKLNAIKADDLFDEVRAFLELIKNSSG